MASSSKTKAPHVSDVEMENCLDTSKNVLRETRGQDHDKPTDKISASPSCVSKQERLKLRRKSKKLMKQRDKIDALLSQRANPHKHSGFSPGTQHRLERAAIQLHHRELRHMQKLAKKLVDAESCFLTDATPKRSKHWNAMRKLHSQFCGHLGARYMESMNADDETTSSSGSDSDSDSDPDSLISPGYGGGKSVTAGDSPEFHDSSYAKRKRDNVSHEKGKTPARVVQSDGKSSTLPQSNKRQKSAFPDAVGCRKPYNPGFAFGALDDPFVDENFFDDFIDEDATHSAAKTNKSEERKKKDKQSMEDEKTKSSANSKAMKRAVSEVHHEVIQDDGEGEQSIVGNQAKAGKVNSSSDKAVSTVKNHNKPGKEAGLPVRPTKDASTGVDSAVSKSPPRVSTSAIPIPAYIRSKLSWSSGSSSPHRIKTPTAPEAQAHRSRPGSGWQSRVPSFSSKELGEDLPISGVSGTPDSGHTQKTWVLEGSGSRKKKREKDSNRAKSNTSNIDKVTLTIGDVSKPRRPDIDNDSPAETASKRKVGRPKGSKNKKKKESLQVEKQGEPGIQRLTTVGVGQPVSLIGHSDDLVKAITPSSEAMAAFSGTGNDLTRRHLEFAARQRRDRQVYLEEREQWRRALNLPPFGEFGPLQ